MTACSGKDRKQQPGFPIAPTSSSRTSNNIIYADVVQNPEAASTDVHSKTAENDYQATDVVVYSELQGKDTGAHTVAPTGDLYAEVQNR